MLVASGGLVSESVADGGLRSKRFEQRSVAAGHTLFTTLPPEHTGVTAVNAYDDPKMWWEKYREFSLGAIGTGIAIGDYNGDGRPDLFVVSKTGPDRLYRNQGEFKFEDVSDRAGVAGPLGAWKQGAAFADINNDGKLDLYVCRYGAPNLLYVNQGDGTFREEAQARGLALEDASGMAAFADYDRDGWLDTYVQTNLLDGERRPNGQRDRLYRNNGDGTFREVTDAAGIRGETQGHSATWWDYNEDGWPDLYVANDFRDPDQLFRNNKDGTFTNVLSWVVPHTPHSAMGADAADLNNDGHIDFLVGDMAATSRYKDHRGMAKLRTGLTDNEQRPDAPPQYMRNALYLNMGGSVILEGAFLAGLSATDWTWSIRLEDFDNDGRVDAFFTNGMVRELHATDIIQRMTAKETVADRIKIMKATPPLNERHLAFRNTGELRFEEVGVAWGLDAVGVGFGAATADFDGDGDLDVVFAQWDRGVSICRNDSPSGHALTLSLEGTTSNRFGVGATVRIETANAGQQVRTLTLARGYLSTSEPSLHFGLGAESVVSRVTVEWPSGARQIFENLPADCHYTVTEVTAGQTPEEQAQTAPRFVEIAEKAQLALVARDRSLYELSKFPLVPFRLDRPGPSITVSKLDADSEDDVVVGGAVGEPARLLSKLGGGQFMAYGAGVFGDQTETADGPILAADLDGDGDADLLETKAGLPPARPELLQPRLLLNDGSGRFSPATDDALPSLPISVGAVAAADFERSGRLSVFVGGRVELGAYPAAPRSALLVRRDNHWLDIATEVSPVLARRGMVTAALWSDVDADGWSDLLVTYDWGQVVCYRNIEGTRFEDASERLGFAAAGTGWWRSISAADFNGDGVVDYAVGNIGLNTRYRASEAEPAVLYAGVSLDGSAPQLVEAQAENGRWFPLRTRETLSKAFPSLARKFPTADSYANASLEEVFGAAALAAATKVTATELRSGVFLSQTGGTFQFVPLPRLAQIAPVHGMAASDLDGDARVDLLMVGNSYSPIPETGRFDGGVGWFLRGDGKGGFVPMPPAESGFVVRHDGRGLALIDLNQDGWPDCVVTRNNDRTLAFQNTATAGRHSFALALRGSSGNVAAIGSRATLTLADGSTQTAEIAAGSGYFSQSTATLFFGYPDGAPPTRLRIRWPDGRETQHSFDGPPPKILRLSSP